MLSRSANVNLCGCVSKRMQIDDSVTRLKGIGSRVAERLHRLDIQSVEDLLHHYPTGYEDYSHVTAIADARPGTVTIAGEIVRLHTRRSRKGVAITEALIRDDTGDIQAVWFNQAYLGRSLPTHTPVYVSGKLEYAYNKYALQSPTVERASSFPRHSARIVPKYPQTSGITSKQLRRWIAQALEVDIPDPIPAPIARRFELMSRAEALQQVHYPAGNDELSRARWRLAVEELAILLLAMRQQRYQLQHRKAPVLQFDQATVHNLLQQLPFDLTDSQRACAWQILQDLGRDYPMQRLLQGDVGSGKTVVAAMAAATAARNGMQTALLAPTEILATQHYKTLQTILQPLGVTTRLLSGAVTAGEKDISKRSLGSGEAQVVVGTHALLEPDVEFQRLGLVVVDEQHRFGVEQRQMLQQKGDMQPHMLSMTATPIPRSLAMTVYADLDVSRLRHLPPGRKPVATSLVERRSELWDSLARHLDDQQQAFVVCPAITSTPGGGKVNVEQIVEQYRRRLPAARIGILHSQLKTAQKQQRIEQFRRHKLDVLVTTTVIEVGVDIPTVNVMVIEAAEQFGLAQLHQLRGRVGRGDGQGYCYLVPSRPRLGRSRLRLLARTTDGIALAHADLKQRGPGQLQGVRQHGQTGLLLADITDSSQVQTAQAVAEALEQLDVYPEPLQRAINRMQVLQTGD